MKEFDVTITETLKLTVSVEASSKEEAQQNYGDPHRASKDCPQGQDRSGDRAMIPSLPMRTEGGKTHAGRN